MVILYWEPIQARVIFGALNVISSFSVWMYAVRRVVMELDQLVMCSRKANLLGRACFPASQNLCNSGYPVLVAVSRSTTLRSGYPGRNSTSHQNLLQGMAFK